MTWLTRQRELKLDLLESLVRSQRALARIIESMADISMESAQTAESFREHVEAIARYQQTVANKMLGIQYGRIKSSRPSPPWLNNKIKVRCTRHLKEYSNTNIEKAATL